MIVEDVTVLTIDAPMMAPSTDNPTIGEPSRRAIFKGGSASRRSRKTLYDTGAAGSFYYKVSTSEVPLRLRP